MTERLKRIGIVGATLSHPATSRRDLGSDNEGVGGSVVQNCSQVAARSTSSPPNELEGLNAGEERDQRIAKTVVVSAAGNDLSQRLLLPGA